VYTTSYVVICSVTHTILGGYNPSIIKRKLPIRWMGAGHAAASQDTASSLPTLTFQHAAAT
jgi:hypothetical protein